MAWGHDHHDHDHDIHLEEAKQRRLRWSLLTDEERALETRRQKVMDRWFVTTFGVTTALVALFAGLVYLKVFHHGFAEQVLAFFAFPVGLVLAGALALYKRGQVR